MLRLGVLPHGHKVAARNNQSGSVLVHGPQKSFLRLSSEQGSFVPRSLQQTPELAFTCPSRRPDHSGYLDKLALRRPLSMAAACTLQDGCPPEAHLGAQSLSCGFPRPFQAAYLVGISDPNSQAGHQGLVDPIQFARANQAIQMACQNLVDPGSSPSQVTRGRGYAICESLSSRRWAWGVGEMSKEYCSYRACKASSMQHCG